MRRLLIVALVLTLSGVAAARQYVFVGVAGALCENFNELPEESKRWWAVGYADASTRLMRVMTDANLPQRWRHSANTTLSMLESECTSRPDLDLDTAMLRVVQKELEPFLLNLKK